MKLPTSLVKTWLELSNHIDPESPKACNSAIEKIHHYFGNPDIAADYVYSNQKPTKTLHRAKEPNKTLNRVGITPKQGSGTPK